MALTYSVPFVQIPIIGLGKVATANTNRNGTGTLVTLVTGSTDGTKVTSVRVKGEVTTTAGMVRLYMSNTTGANDASNTFLIMEIEVSAITVSASVASFSSTIPFSDLVIPSGYTLRASTEKAESFSVTAYGANY